MAAVRNGPQVLAACTLGVDCPEANTAGSPLPRNFKLTFRRDLPKPRRMSTFGQFGEGRLLGWAELSLNAQRVDHG
jgi:hypothetical protein